MPIAIYLLKELLNNGAIVDLIISDDGIITFKQEMQISLSSNPDKTKEILVTKYALMNPDKLHVYNNANWYAPIASGSSVNEHMIICPCSMATLGRVANAIGEDLISRAADVCLKERKNLVIVPRESPLGTLHLTNLLTLSGLGVCILPPVPAFYTHPKSIDDIISFIVNRILDQVQIKAKLAIRW